MHKLTIKYITLAKLKNLNTNPAQMSILFKMTSKFNYKFSFEAFKTDK